MVFFRVSFIIHINIYVCVIPYISTYYLLLTLYFTDIL